MVIKKQFTLIEILVVIVILSVLATILLPVFIQQKKKGEQKAERAMIVGSLRMIHVRVWVWVSV